MLLTLLGIVFNAIILVACLSEPPYIAALIIDETVNFLVMAVVNFYLGLFVFGAATLITEWKQIQIPARHKVLYLFTFPIFMLTYVPISLSALVRKVEWKPIYHGVASKGLKSGT